MRTGHWGVPFCYYISSLIFNQKAPVEQLDAKVQVFAVDVSNAGEMPAKVQPFYSI
ncbi:hypothetical protein D3C74_142990 [compost metagenome]